VYCCGHDIMISLSNRDLITGGNLYDPKNGLKQWFLEFFNDIFLIFYTFGGRICYNHFIRCKNRV
jgi:hypothetical protein